MAVDTPRNGKNWADVVNTPAFMKPIKEAHKAKEKSRVFLEGTFDHKGRRIK